MSRCTECGCAIDYDLSDNELIDMLEEVVDKLVSRGWEINRHESSVKGVDYSERVGRRIELWG